MRRLGILLVLLSAAGGCGAQGALLGAERGYLFTALDAISPPGEPVELRGRLQGGDLLTARAGYVVRFRREGELFKAAETDGHGFAAVTFTPPAPGQYRFTVDLSANGFADAPPAPIELLLTCCREDAPIVIVDLDKTLVASGFQEVLIGDPVPMARSNEVMKRLAQRYTVVYLTHRPDLFAGKSKAWLRSKGYPPGPLLLSDIGGFLKGSEAFKSGALADLREQFKRIEIGIGDKIADAKAYHDNAMAAYLIVQPTEVAGAEALRQMAEDIGALPEAVQVVTGWDEVEAGIFNGAKFARSRLQKRLIAMAEALDAKARPKKQ